MHRFAFLATILVGLVAASFGGDMSPATAAQSDSELAAVALVKATRSLPPAVSRSTLALRPARPALRSGSLSSPTPLATLPPAVPQTSSRTRSVPGLVPALTTAPDAFHQSQQQILINQDRAANGALAPLAWSSCLANIALQNAQRIAAQGSLSHTNGPTLDLACDGGYSRAGENIAYTSRGTDDAQVNDMFMNSAPHRANILGTSYRYVGTAWVVAANGYGYIAVEFAG